MPNKRSGVYVPETEKRYLPEDIWDLQDAICRVLKQVFYHKGKKHYFYRNYNFMFFGEKDIIDHKLNYERVRFNGESEIEQMKVHIHRMQVVVRELVGEVYGYD
jgi:hypothetical protein